MSQNRLDGLDEIQKKTRCKVININVTNLHQYVKKGFPLHPGYKYLSNVHKADYLRCYLMHHYGGGYSDIKRALKSWVECFNIINNNKDIWMIGLGGEFGMAYPKEYNKEQRAHLKKHQSKMVGIGYFICRPYTPFTTEWYNNLHKRLDDYLPILKKHPAIYSRESYDRPPENGVRMKKMNV